MKIFKITIGICLLFSILAGVGHAQERQKKQPTSGNATIYFLRPDGLYAPTSPTVKVAGRPVGDLSAGTYVMVNRPPGHYPIEVVGGLFASSWESEIDVAAGQTYFIQVSTRGMGGPAMQLLTGAIAGTTGRPMPGRGFNAPFSFYALDGAQGRTEIAKMKREAAR